MLLYMKAIAIVAEIRNQEAVMLHRRPFATRRVEAALCSLLLTFSVFRPQAVDAGTLFDGTEFQANTYTTHYQYGQPARSVSRSTNGSFVVVWQSYGQDGSEHGVHGQRYDANGVPVGTEFQANTHTTSEQDLPAVSVGEDGSFVVVWESLGQDGSGFGIHGQRYDANGAPDGTEFQVNTYTTNSQQAPAVSTAADGSFVVVWDSYPQDGSGDGIQGQRFDSSGVPVGTEFQVNTHTTSSQRSPDVSSAADGRFTVVWESMGQDGSGRAVLGQRYDAGGVPDGTEFQINTFTEGFQGDAALSTAADGSTVVVWTSGHQDGGSFSVQGQRYDATGAAEGTEFQVNTYTTGAQEEPAVALDADGAFLVAWESEGQDGDAEGVHAQRFDAAGAPDGTEFQVNTFTTSDQYYSQSVASDGVGNFVVVWFSFGQDDAGAYGGMFGQLLCTDADDNGNCDASCPLVPRSGCNAATIAKLDINEKKAGKEKTKLQWKKLAGATVQADFGDPVGGGTAVAVCIYDDADALVQEYSVDRAGALCAGKDCWKASGSKGYGYKDKASSSDGLAKIGFKAGAPAKGKADTLGKNNLAKGQTALPVGVVAQLTGNSAPTIQMVSTGGFCSTATMNSVKKDEPTRYLATFK